MRNYLLTGLVVFTLSCSNTKKMKEASTDTGKQTYVQGEFDKQGHRGCRGLMPENTVPAMLYALGMGVSTLEMDVVITKDKKVILSHEPWFGKEITTKPDGKYIGEREERTYNIYWMTYEQTKTFDVGMKPHPRFPQQQKMKVTKPLLADVIDSIMAVIKEKQIEDFVIIQSFDFRTLQYLHLKYPHIKTAMLIEDFDKRSLVEQIKALGFIPTIYSPAFVHVNEKLVKSCHSQNMKIIPWTVNTKEKIAELKAMGVDGIITDYPNLFIE